MGESFKMDLKSMWIEKIVNRKLACANFDTSHFFNTQCQKQMLRENYNMHALSGKEGLFCHKKTVCAYNILMDFLSILEGCSISHALFSQTGITGD